MHCKGHTSFCFSTPSQWLPWSADRHTRDPFPRIMSFMARPDLATVRLTCAFETYHMQAGKMTSAAYGIHHQELAVFSKQHQSWPRDLSRCQVAKKSAGLKVCMQVHAGAWDFPAILWHPASASAGCAPRVPASRHRRRVLQPQRLQATVCAEVFGQRLALQARQGGDELYCPG